MVLHLCHIRVLRHLVAAKVIVGLHNEINQLFKPLFKTFRNGENETVILRNKLKTRFNGFKNVIVIKLPLFQPVITTITHSRTNQLTIKLAKIIETKEFFPKRLMAIKQTKCLHLRKCDPLGFLPL